MGGCAFSKNPVMDVIGHGKDAYVWIGDGSKTGHCFGHVTVDKLRAFLKKVK